MDADLEVSEVPSGRYEFSLDDEKQQEPVQESTEESVQAMEVDQESVEEESTEESEDLPHSIPANVCKALALFTRFYKYPQSASYRLSKARVCADFFKNLGKRKFPPRLLGEQEYSVENAQKSFYKNLNRDTRFEDTTKRLLAEENDADKVKFGLLHCNLASAVSYFCTKGKITKKQRDILCSLTKEQRKVLTDAQRDQIFGRRKRKGDGSLFSQLQKRSQVEKLMRWTMIQRRNEKRLNLNGCNHDRINGKPCAPQMHLCARDKVKSWSTGCNVQNTNP
jgi:hypothetical protein